MLRALTAASYDRSYYPSGVPRQLAAMILDGSRADSLRALAVPTSHPVLTSRSVRLYAAKRLDSCRSLVWSVNAGGR